MIQFEEAKKNFADWGKGFYNKKVSLAFEVNDGYVFLLENRDKSITVDNPYFIVKKKNGAIKQYFPLKNPKEYVRQSKINLLKGDNS